MITSKVSFDMFVAPVISRHFAIKVQDNKNTEKFPRKDTAFKKSGKIRIPDR